MVGCTTVRLHTTRSLLVLFCAATILSLCAISRSSEQKTVILAFSQKQFSGINVRDVRVALEMWSRIIAKKKQHSFILTSRIYDDPRAIIRGLEKGEIGYANMTALDYVKIRKQGLVEPFLVSLKNGKVLEDFALLVNENAHIKDLSQLRGKRLVMMAGSNGQIASLWLETLLRKKKLPALKKFFSSSREAADSSDVIMPVYSGQQDVCVVTCSALSTLRELRPDAGKKLVIMARSPPFLVNILCYNKKFNDEIITKELTDSAMNLHSDPVAKQVVMLLHVDQFRVYRPSDLDSVTELYKEYILQQKEK